MNSMARRIIGERMSESGYRGRDYDDYPRHHHDHDYDYEYDRHERRHKAERHHKKGELRLTKADIKHWKHMLKNGDGSTGEHFTMEHMREVIHHIGANFEEYDEMELCMTANMLYSDLCEALRPMVPKEKEAMVYANMAKDWLEDDDGPEGSEKLALYYYCIVDGDE